MSASAEVLDSSFRRDTPSSLQLPSDMKELAKTGFVHALIAKLSPEPKDVAKWIREVRKENPELSNDELADYIGDKIVWTYTMQGAALALPGAIPGLGTAIQISTEVGLTTADVALMIRNQSYLVFALGHIYGFRSRVSLVQDALVVIGLWANALSMAKSGVVYVGTKVASANLRKHFSGKILLAINRKVSTTILTKYGTKRGGIALGKLIPFGLGSLVAGGFNYITMKAFKRQTMSYLSTKAPRPKQTKTRRPLKARAKA